MVTVFVEWSTTMPTQCIYVCEREEMGEERRYRVGVGVGVGVGDSINSVSSP